MSPEQILASTTARVLEEIAFVLVAEVEEAALDDMLEATVEFAGPTKGRIGLALHRGLLREALGNTLSDEGTEDEVGSLAMELTNIVTGAVLDDWWGPKGNYDLGLPVLGPLTGGSIGTLLADEMGRGVRVSVRMEDPS